MITWWWTLASLQTRTLLIVDRLTFKAPYTSNSLHYFNSFSIVIICYIQHLSRTQSFNFILTQIKILFSQYVQLFHLQFSKSTLAPFFCALKLFIKPHAKITHTGFPPSALFSTRWAKLAKDTFSALYKRWQELTTFFFSLHQVFKVVSCAWWRTWFPIFFWVFCFRKLLFLSFKLFYFIFVLWLVCVYLK